MNGKNFNEIPLLFEEFIEIKNNQFAFANFFLNFYNYHPGRARNYERLRVVNQILAEELSAVHYQYGMKRCPVDENDLIEGHFYPKSILEKGYQAYLILRKEFKNDPILLKRIADYNFNRNPKIPDDIPAFFS
ncbi:MAG: hypothetical protein WCT50_04140 [Patescibacteria group bacterium]